ncbi:MAG: glycosyltransferase family 9 protein, partial [Candidatus Omnitrophica bacterium]|nr:glycosyltransferase family 9 protein [Candidatus Omnitrophota bacterium]
LFNSYFPLVDKNLGVDELIKTNYKCFFSKNVFIRWGYKITWFIKIYKYMHNSDILICLDKHSLFTKFAKYVCGIKDIVGPNNLWFGYDIKNNDSKYFTKTVIMPEDSDRNHCMMRYQHIIRSVYSNYNLSIPKIPDTSNLANKIIKLIGNTKKYKIVLCTQGTAVWKCFGLDYSIKLLDMLKQLNNVTFFIVGSSINQKKEADLIKLKLQKMDIHNICCKTSLLELKEFLKNMDLLISVDTGVAHLAAVSNIPIISFYGATLPEQTGPITSKANMIYHKLDCLPCNSQIEINKKICKEPKCIYNVTPKHVMEIIIKILSSKK